MKIFRESTREKARERARFELSALFRGLRERDILFLSSGGSALELLESFDEHSIDSFCTISMIDERYSREERVNNFSQLSRTPFYRKASTRGVRWIDTRVMEGETLEELEERFEGALRAWKANNPFGRVIATLGMGTDGHIAGIMPYPENPGRFSFLFEDPHQWVIGYDATKEKNEFPLRVTAQMTFLRTIVDYGVAYIAGEEKRVAFERVLVPEGQLPETPARILREMKNIVIVTDLGVQ